MGLLATIRHIQPTYSLDQAARMLADSNTDLSDADLVTDALIGLGIMPWLMVPHDDGRPVDMIEIWVEAHNIRTLRIVATRRYPMPYSGY